MPRSGSRSKRNRTTTRQPPLTDPTASQQGNAVEAVAPPTQGGPPGAREETPEEEDRLSIILSSFFFFSHFYFSASGQAVITGVVPSPPRFLPSIFIAHRVQQSHCSSIFHRVLLTHALALSASQFAHKKKSHRNNTSIHSAGPELTKLTYTRLEDNLIRHRGDRLIGDRRVQVNHASLEI